MLRTILILIALVNAGAFPFPIPLRLQSQEQAMRFTPSEVPTTVTINTAGNFLGLKKDRYNAGDQILVAITMTNQANDPLDVCLSSDIYQNVPTLTRNGEVVPIMAWQKYEQQQAERNATCQDVNRPETVILNPKEPKMVDWFVLVDSETGTGAEAWYNSLPPGKYELSIKRRLRCCDGPMLESNKVSFEIVQ
jgi:hypothetical protein